MNAHVGDRVGGLTPLLRHAQGRVVAGLSVDHVVADGDFLAISGWAIGGQDLTFTENVGGLPAHPPVSFVARDDVAAGYGVDPKLAKGFLAIWKSRPREALSVRLGCHDSIAPLQMELPAPDDCSEQALMRFLAENLPRAGALFEGLLGNPCATAFLVKHIAPIPKSFNRARGYLEMAKGVEGVGGLVIGWGVGEPGLRFYLVDEDGCVVALAAAARWTRNDIVEAMGCEFGDYAYDAGFLQGWNGRLRIGTTVQLIVATEDAAYRLSETRWLPAPIEAVSFARWAFEISTPRETFAQRLANHDGAIIHGLIERKIATRSKRPPKIHDYGKILANPRCSVVVPLHGRHDLMLNQLLAFSEDLHFVTTAELIYVIDDHRLVSPLSVDAPMFAASFEVPFRTVSSGENRGFAGATNLGVAASRAPFVLLMNSDVIPVAQGWLKTMLSTLAAHPEIGLLGVRLHYPNGAIQHEGMEFRWDATWEAFLNKHPGGGMPGSAPTKELVKCPAVTAACALIRRDIYDAVGGLDETFLIGDFEDSDLCLKVRELGLEIACLQNPVSLIHLERQSFSGIGSPSFREYIARYNAWRHQTRWGDFISKMSLADVSREKSP